MDLVFLDANVLFSAAYRTDAGIRRLWELPEVELVTSAHAVEEARRNLDTPQQLADLEKLLSAVRSVTVLPAARSLPSLVELPEKDRPILLTAIELKASHLLTGDYKHFGQYYGQVIEGVLILPPADYLRALSK
jgi:predicted nucleic acid-binding protein